MAHQFRRPAAGNIASLEEVRETNSFALANAGKPIEAIAKIAELMTLLGPTSERLGLLGGRYKQLSAKAATLAERLFEQEHRYLRARHGDRSQPILLLQQSPRLYLQRNHKGDPERTVAVSQIVMAACERAKKRKEADEWLRPPPTPKICIKAARSPATQTVMNA